MTTSLLTFGALGAALLLAVLDWAAVARRDRRSRYVFKPVTMVAVIAAVVLLILLSAHDPWQAFAFLVGFAFSLAGDIFLLLPSDRYFMPGLVSFLLAHLCYIIGLNQTLPPASALLLALPILVIGLLLFSRIRAGLLQSGHRGLVPAVALYSLVISVMLWSAWAALFRFGPDWPFPRQALIAVGASLFFMSDSILAWDRFVERKAWGDMVVMITYHLGQIALAGSLAFSG